MEFALWTAEIVAEVILFSLAGVFWIGFVVLALGILALLARRAAA